MAITTTSRVRPTRISCACLRPLARKGPEHERDLFYRGLGYFQAPLTVGMDADEQQLSLSAREAEQIVRRFSSPSARE